MTTKFKNLYVHQNKVILIIFFHCFYLELQYKLELVGKKDLTKCNNGNITLVGKGEKSKKLTFNGTKTTNKSTESSEQADSQVFFYNRILK